MRTLQSRAAFGNGRSSLVRAVAQALAPLLTVSGLVPVSVVAAAAGALVAADVAAAPSAKATTPPDTVLVLLQNGQTTAPEEALLQNERFTVQHATPSTWQTMTTAQFQQYAALVIGDPSSGTCSNLTPSLSGTGGDVIGTTWQAAVTGNIAILGTAPILAGTPAANSLISGMAGYAAAAYNSGSATGTGLYVSLNCDYSGSAAGTAVAFLNGVENIGTGTGQAGAVTLNGSLSCADPGTVNKWEAESSGTLSSLTSDQLSGTGNWPSPSCPVREAFDSWPANFTPLGVDGAADATATFTTSAGQSGQPYMLFGTPPLTTSTPAGRTSLNLAASTGGQAAELSAPGGFNNAAPGVVQPTAGDGVNTENGDLSEDSTDTALPTFGPSLFFERIYDAQAAQAQTTTQTPGPMGYGWTDNWATSMTTSNGTAVPGDIYAISGLGTDNGNGGDPTKIPLSFPGPVMWHNDTYFSDTSNNRVLMVPGTSGFEWGMQMTAGNVYQIAGSPIGDQGRSKDGTAMTNSLLDDPTGITLDSAGDLYIADSGNNRVIEIPAASGTQWNIPMTADDIYDVAGHGTGASGHGGDGSLAVNAFLSDPEGLAFDPAGDLYIADSTNSRVQEVFTTGGQQWSQTPMTANDIYTVAGSTAGTSGDTSTNGTAATSALLNNPDGISFSSAGDMFVADSLNNRVIEVPQASGTQWGSISMSANDLYTVAGSPTGVAGSAGDGGLATSAKLNDPEQIELDNGKQLYIADAGNNRIQEVARTTHSEWNVSMTNNDMYTIAGTGTSGFTGNNGPALSAELDDPQGFALDGTANLYIADSGNNRIRAVSGTTFNITAFAGNGASLLNVGNNGPALGSAYQEPSAVMTDKVGNIYIADQNNNRVQEIAASSHTQFQITMTAGDVYTIAGHANGAIGDSGDGGPATAAKLNGPIALAIDSSGNLYIADSGNNRIAEVSAATGFISTVAGNAAGGSGSSGDNGPATAAFLDDPNGVAVDGNGNLYISDFFNNRIQEVPASGGPQWGKTMTAGDIYTVAGNPAGNSGTSGDGGAVASALLNSPAGVAVDAAGDVYIADEVNNRIQEMFASGGQTFGQQMTAGDMYTVAGSASGAAGLSGDGGPATSSRLNFPDGLTVSTAGDLYIADSSNNRIQEVPTGTGLQWARQMTAADIYTVAGSPTGALGNSGLGGPATSAKMNSPDSLAIDPSGNMYIPDSTNDLIDEVVSASSTAIFALSPPPGTGTPAGLTITEPTGAQSTFYAIGAGCVSPDTPVASGQFCAAPQDVGANLSFSAGNYLYTPASGSFTLTYNSAGQLASESDNFGNSLQITHGSPLPGSGNCPASATTCDTVTAANGRTLTIGYNAASFVTSVTDPMGRQWTYGYTGSDLTSATDPMGNVTSYTYGVGTTGNPLNANDLLTVTDPNEQPGGPDAGVAASNVYNTAGQVTSQTDELGYVTHFNYCVDAAAGNCMNSSTGNGLTTVTRPDGTKAIYGYAQGIEQSITIPNGTAPPSERDFGADLAAGTLLTTWQTNEAGARTVENHDSAGNLTSSTDPLGNVTTTHSNSLGEPGCMANAMAASACSTSQTGPPSVAPGGVITPPSAAPPAGVTYTLYDNDGEELYSETGVYPPGSSTPSAVQTDYTLYKNNSVTLNGATITCASQPPAVGMPCATIDPNGSVAQYAYDSYGDLVSESSPDGNGSELATTTYVYDPDGEPTSSTSPDGNVSGVTPAVQANFTTVSAYNADGQVTSVTQAGGAGASATPRTSTIVYDADGQVTKSTDARGFSTSTQYNAAGNPVLVTDPTGNSALTCYDSSGTVAQTVPPAGVASADLTAASCPTNYPVAYSIRLASDATNYVYNSLGEETSVTTAAPAGQSGPRTTTMTYTSAGLPATTTYPPGSNTPGAPPTVVTDTYDADGQLLTETTGSGASASTVSHCYDPNGDLTSTVAPDGNVSAVAPCNTNPSHPYIVDPVAYSTQASYQMTTSFDSTGNVLTTTSPATAAAPSGATTSMTYNVAGDVATSTDPKGIITTYSYNQAGRETGISYSGSSAHSVSYGYDANDNVTSMTDASGTSTYGYDPFSELTSATNGAGQTTGFGYDADGHQSSITYPLPASATWATSDTVTYGYDHADRLASVTDFNGHTIAVADNADGLPNSVTLGSSGDTVTTAYDATGVPSAITVKNGASSVLGFSYADAPSGAILSETDTPGSSAPSYSYDQLGRLTSVTTGSTTLDYGMDASGNLSVLPNQASATYDKAGELTSAVLGANTMNYSYDADGQRLTSTQGTATLTSAAWNGAGQLTSYSDPAAAMTSATYDGNGMRTSNTTGGSSQAFTWNGSTLLMDGTNAYIYGLGVAPTEQVNLSTGAISYLATDALGSVRGVIAGNGSLTASTSYDAWGNPQWAGGLTAYTPFGYSGGYTDPTGLIYLTNRYYDPATGQFASADPAGTGYAYADGNPVSLSDPSGLWAFPFWTGTEFDSELEFQKWVANIWQVTPGGNGWEYQTQWNSGVPGSVTYYGNRRIDVFADNISNEVKTGYTSLTSSKRGTKGEAIRDNWMVFHNNSACHPYYKGATRHCSPVSPSKGIWWFSAKGGSGCQVLDNLADAITLCASKPLRYFLSGKGLNRIYVFLAPEKYRKEADSYYADTKQGEKIKAAIRQALEVPGCPTKRMIHIAKTIDPQWKFPWPKTWTLPYNPANDPPTPWIC